jgi:hypothetical protein
LIRIVRILADLEDRLVLYAPTGPYLLHPPNQFFELIDSNCGGLSVRTANFNELSYELDLQRINGVLALRLSLKPPGEAHPPISFLR